MPTSVLLIDDDRKLTQLLTTYLAQFDMEALAAHSADEGLKLLRQKTPRMVVLDVMLPGRDGFQICREIRQESGAIGRTPIIMLTARGEVTDRIVGLEIGADDYLSKPFEPRELVARIQTILRRTSEQSSIHTADTGVFISQNLELDPTQRSARLDNQDLELTTTEFEILSLFMRHPGSTLSRDQIMDAIRGVDWEAFDRSVDVAISRLRHKLQDPVKSPRFFKTVWGTGYLFIGKVEKAERHGK